MARWTAFVDAEEGGVGLEVPIVYSPSAEQRSEILIQPTTAVIRHRSKPRVRAAVEAGFPNHKSRRGTLLANWRRSLPHSWRQNSRQPLLVGQFPRVSSQGSQTIWIAEELTSRPFFGCGHERLVHFFTSLAGILSAKLSSSCLFGHRATVSAIVPH